MNRIPSNIKSNIADFIFAETESYTQYIPAKAIELAKVDLELVCKIRLLCNGDSNFLRNRFKITKTIDTLACTQARKNMVFSILRFKHLDGKWFQLPILKTQKNTFEAFIKRYNDSFSDTNFKIHLQTLQTLTDKVTAFRRRQAYILRLLKRDISR